MNSHLRAGILALSLLTLVAAGCSSADGGGSDTSTAPPATSAPRATSAPTSASAPATSPTDTEGASGSPSPGTVTLDVSGIGQARDLILLGLIGSSTPLQAGAAICQPIGADPYSFSGKFMPMTGDNPCTLGVEPMEFDPGPYTMVVAVIRGGQQSPERCTEVDVTVDGDVTVEVAVLGPPSDCTF